MYNFVCVQCLQYMYCVYSVYSIHTVQSKFICTLCTVYVQCVYSIYTVCTVCLQYIAVCSVFIVYYCVYSVFIVYVLCVQCMCSVFTVYYCLYSVYACRVCICIWRPKSTSAVVPHGTNPRFLRQCSQSLELIKQARLVNQRAPETTVSTSWDFKYVLAVTEGLHLTQKRRQNRASTNG